MAKDRERKAKKKAAKELAREQFQDNSGKNPDDFEVKDAEKKNV